MSECIAWFAVVDSGLQKIDVLRDRTHDSKPVGISAATLPTAHFVTRR